MPPKVVIYTTPTCVFCGAAKNLFKKNNTAYEEYNVATDLARRKEMIERSGQMGVPVIYVGEELVVGFDEPRLSKLLAVKQ